MLTYVIDRLVEEEKAVIGINDLSIQRGYGVFDFFRTSHKVPLFIDDYLDRFFNSAAALRLQPTQSRQEIMGIVYEMIRLNNLETSGFKLILTGGYSADGFEPATPNIIITQQSIQLTTADQFERGIKIILHDYMRDVPFAKSINYLMSIYLREKILQADADEVLYYNDEVILEFPRSNLFIVTNDQTVVTSANNVLPGITRMKVLELASQQYKTEERDVSVEDLANAAEVFLTSTTKRILPVVTIEGRSVGDGTPGKITRSLYHSFLQAEAAYISRFKS